MKKSFLLKIFCLCFIFGVLLANFIDFNFDVFYLFVILLACLILSIFFWSSKKTYAFVLLVMVIFLLGVWRLAINEPRINENHISYYTGQNLTFVGQVINLPDVRTKYRQLTLGKNVILAVAGAIPESRLLAAADKNKSRQRLLPVKGKILVNAPNYPAYAYGDTLKIRCQIEAGGKIEDFDYGKFLAVKGIYATCNFADNITLLTENLSARQKIIKAILSLKNTYQKIINQSLNFPESEILLAMIVGLERGIPEELMNKFRTTGLAHIMVVSGQNITLLSGIIMNILLALGLRRRQAFYLAILCLTIFLIMIGFQASGMRAGIMGFLVLLSLQTGRLNKGGNTLLLAAVILLLFRPELLFGDIGFQLSFLAVIGIMYLSEPISQVLAKIKVPEKLAVRSSLSMTLAAQATVLPLLVYYFGNLSLIAPLANILVLPLIPFIMLSGLWLLFAGLIFLPLAKILGLVINVVIDWILFITTKLAALPGASLNAVKIDLGWILLIYLLLGWLLWQLNRKRYAG